MKTFTIKEIVMGQEAVKATRYEDTRFIGDYEPIEFCKSDYTTLTRVSTDVMPNKLVEKVVATRDMDSYLITASTTVFAGEKQVNYISQQLTLKGYNSFMKNEDCTVYHNMYLQGNGYDITVDDILELGVYNPEYQVTMLQFTDEDGNYHTLTCNTLHQLSKISKKLSTRKVNTNSSISSAF